MKTSAMIAALGMLIALPVAAQEMFFYPSQGQSPEQQNKDQGECHAWAVHQTGFDPANPPAPAAAAPAPAPQGGLLRGAARGALIGPVVLAALDQAAPPPRLALYGAVRQAGAVQNMSRDWVIDKMTVSVTYDPDLDKVKRIIKQIGKELAQDPEFALRIIEPHEKPSNGPVGRTISPSAGFRDRTQAGKRLLAGKTLISAQADADVAAVREKTRRPLLRRPGFKT